MGLLAFLRGDDILDSTESRTFPRPENEFPVLWPGIEPVRSVGTHNVLAIADAYACVRVLADSISTLPLKVFRRTDAGPRVGWRRPAPRAAASPAESRQHERRLDLADRYALERLR